jgi:hypothetical protein
VKGDGRPRTTERRWIRCCEKRKGVKKKEFTTWDQALALQKKPPKACKFP